MSNFSARWVLRILTLLQKQEHIKCWWQVLDFCRDNKDEVWKLIVTRDELGFIILSMSPSRSPYNCMTTPTKKFKVLQSTGKIMATLLFGGWDILLINYKNKYITITREYYSSLLKQVKGSVKEKIRKEWTRNMLLLSNNVPMHKSNAVLVALYDCDF